MTELERALIQVGQGLAFPDAPDVSERVLQRLRSESAPRRRGVSRRAFVLAFAVLALAIGAAMAVPPARTAILDFFGLRGATVQRVETLPTVPRPSESILDLGRPVPMGEDGRPDVKIPEVLVPAALGPPDAAYASPESYGTRLTLVYAPGEGVPESPYTGVGILVSEFVGEPFPGYVDKMVDGGTRVERVKVGPHRGLWLEGGPHVVMLQGDAGQIFEDQGRLAGNTLLVERDDVLVRIEGEISRARAIEIAESLR
jgi:hypothetical protein